MDKYFLRIKDLQFFLSVVLVVFIALFWLHMLVPDTKLFNAALGVGAFFFLGCAVSALSNLFVYDPSTRDRVRKHSVELVFLDGKGDEAKILIRRLFRSRKRGLRTYEWRFRSDNGIGIDGFDVEPGAVVHETYHLGQHRITQDFGRPARWWRLMEIEFRGVFVKAFTDPQREFWETATAMPTRELEITIRFHPDHLPDPNNITVREVIGFSEFDVPGQPSLYSEKGGSTQIYWRVKHPRHLATYRLSWKWQQNPAG